MIIDGTLYFDIKIGDYKDFLSFEDLISFKMVQHSGAGTVSFAIAFRTSNEKIKSLLIRNNPVIIYLGPNKENCEVITTYPTKTDYDQGSSENQYSIYFESVINYPFITERASNAYKGTSKEVINEICKKYFNKELVTDVIPFESEKEWIRSYKSGAEFLLEVWLHMYLGKDRCPMMYIHWDGQAYLKDLYDIKKGPTSVKFVSHQVQSKASNEIQYLNNFNPESYVFTNQIAIGEQNVVAISNIEKGIDSLVIPEGFPDIAATTEIEKAIIHGTRQTECQYQTDNVHDYYQEAYQLNKARLIRLNNYLGSLQIYGFHPEISILDLVDVEGGTPELSGKYIVDTITLTFGGGIPPTTNVIVSRDNRNRIEDASVSVTSKVMEALQKVFKQQLANTLQSIRNLRRLVIMGRQILDGTFIKRSIAYLNNFKYNMLTSFSLFGTTINFNDKLALIDSLKAAGNSFCNQLINAFLPYPYNYVFKDFAITDINMKGILSKLLYEFSPSQELRGLLIEITELFSDLTHKASDLYDNGYKQMKLNEYSESGYGSLSYYDGKSPYMETDMSLLTDQEKIQAITDEFIANTDGADIPIPQVDLTESEGLLPMDDLRDLMANKTVIKLREKGYLWGIDNFREILLGEEPMDFNTISKINENIGNMLYARYWGTFKDPSELTDFFVKNAFKDIYVTVPTTKIINALRGSRVFMALPKLEENLTFYINNKEVEMDVLEDLNLGLYTISGYPLLYNVYMSKGTFNSNNTILEVRKGRS